ncbi:hypothetical protein LA080_003206 [Diaporthe eres]|nr:hypothetical protein LA080_003206 [Diaporthe eres]
MASAASTGDKRGHHLRVLSVGLPRTGSKSMLRALEIFGYRNVHHLGQIWWKPREWAFLDRAADASFPSLSTYRPGLGPVHWDEMFGGNDAITDAAGIFGPQLVEAYPDAKCVMVVRDFDAWAHGWLSAYLIDPLVSAYSTRAMRKMFMGAMRCREGDARKKEVLRRYYDEHYATIQKMVPPDRLCVMRLGDGWEPLCRFLGHDVPEVSFPHENDTNEMHLGWQYLRWGILKVAARRSIPWNTLDGDYETKRVDCDEDKDEGEHTQNAKWLQNFKRHIKCDEARPSCLRCIQAGWACDGYDADKASSTASTKGKGAVANVPGLVISISSYAIPFRVPGSQRDRQILHYFCVQGAHEIASHFNVDFWTNTVLKQSHQESVVRQALVALSSLHLDYTTTAVCGTGDTKHGALAQYGRAIHALRRRIERPNRETVKTALTCCILFYCFEATLGDSAAAMRHLDSGLDLLSTHRHCRELDNSDDLDNLSPIFESLDLQATIFDDGRIPRLFLSTEVPRGPAAFPCLDEANRAFIKLQNSVFHLLTEHTSYKFCTADLLPAFVAEEKSLLQQQFDVWLARFEQSNFRGDQDETGNCGRHILLIQWYMSKMLLEANYPTNDLVFGASPNFRAERILDMAQKVFDHSQGGGTGLKQDADEKAYMMLEAWPGSYISSQSDMPLFRDTMSSDGIRGLNRDRHRITIGPRSKSHFFLPKVEHRHQISQECVSQEIEPNSIILCGWRDTGVAEPASMSMNEVLWTSVPVGPSIEDNAKVTSCAGYGCHDGSIEVKKIDNFVTN